MSMEGMRAGMPPGDAVVITGGSSGIGRAMARRHCSAGRCVVLVARREAELAAAAADLRRSAGGGGEVLTIAVDVTAPDAAATIWRAVNAHGLRVGTLINCAGMGLAGEFAQQPLAAINDLIELNVLALTQLTRFAVEAMRERGGTIVNVASLGGYVPGPYQAVYYASKAFVLSFSEALATELSGTGIRVVVVAPGPAQTTFHERMGTERALYRLLWPAASPDHIARSIDWGMRLGLRVVIPGVLPRLLAIAVRLLPHFLTVPLVAELIRPRRR